MIRRWLKRCGVPALLSLLVGLPVSVQACKYSVRDVGFVDLATDTYGLYLFLGPGTDANRVTDAKTIAAATFVESNLNLVVADLGREPDHPSRWMAESAGLEQFPAALLRSPGGESLPVPLSEVQDGSPTEDALWDLMDNTLSSPKREALLELLVDAFAVVVLLEGEDAEQNQAARTAIDGATQAIKTLMPRMPKPVDTPPQLLVIPAGEREQESILAWALGLDLAVTEEAQAAIVMGRGRRLGPPLQGGLITKTRLEQMLALIGQDCECELDRTWMQGPMVPLRWDSGQQKLAYDALGFDPENPLVKAEISRILARGPNARGVTGGTAGVSLDTLFMGYSEEPIELGAEPDLGTDAEAEVSAVAEKTTQTANAPSLPEPAVVLEDAIAEPADANESPSQFPVALLTLVGLGVIALLGGAIVIVRGDRI